MGFKFDATISISTLLEVAGVLAVFWRMFLADRDIKRSMATMLADHEKRIVDVEERQETHHEWLVRNGLDAPPVSRRSGL